MRIAKTMWRLYQGGRCLGTYSADEIATLTGINRKNILTYADTHFLYKKKYKLEKVETTADFCEEWKNVTTMLLRKGRQ